MPYTSSQQAKLDSAKASLDSAKSILDSSTADANSKYSSLGNCVKGKGTTSNCSDGQPLGTGGYPKFGETGNSGVCNVCNSLKDCLSDCCNEATCSTRMNAYNSSITNYNTAVSAYDNAKKNYDTVLSEVSVELENDPELQSQIATATATAEGEATVTLVKWIIIGTLAFLVIGGYVYFKWIRKGKGASAGAGAGA